MQTKRGLHFFSYRSALVFFVFMITCNLLIYAIGTGLSWNMNLVRYLSNTVGCSVGLTAVVTLIEKKCRSVKAASFLFLSLLIVSAGVCYIILYLS